MALPVLALGCREPAGALGTKKLTSAVAPTRLGERSWGGKADLPCGRLGCRRDSERNRTRDVLVASECPQEGPPEDHLVLARGQAIEVYTTFEKELKWPSPATGTGRTWSGMSGRLLPRFQAGSRMPSEQAVEWGDYSRGELRAKVATVVVSVGLEDLTFSDYAVVEKEGV